MRKGDAKNPNGEYCKHSRNSRRGKRGSNRAARLNVKQSLKSGQYRGEKF